MCQILHLSPGATIPASLLERTCDINADGFGFAVRHKGSFVIERDLRKNDHKQIGKLLGKWKDKERFLHLRYATVGAVTQDNNHPFVVLDQKGPQVLMMHNGTLNGKEYEPEATDKITSDTFLFNKKFLTPLAERIWAYTKGKTSILADPIFRKTLGKEVGMQWSVLLMMDNFGEALTVNGSHGKDFDWGGAQKSWVSNDYSFNDNHIRSSARQTRITRPSESDYGHDGQLLQPFWLGEGYPDMNGEGGEHKPRRPWEEWTPPPSRVEEIQNGWNKETGSKSAAASAAVFESAHQAFEDAEDKYELAEEIHEWVTAIRIATSKAGEKKGSLPMSDTAIQSLRWPRETFLKMAELPNLNPVANLTFEDLAELLEEFPKAGAHLVIDIFTRMKTLEQHNATQTKTIQGLLDDKGAGRGQSKAS